MKIDLYTLILETLERYANTNTTLTSQHARMEIAKDLTTVVTDYRESAWDIPFRLGEGD